MQLERSVSFPSSIEARAGVPDSARLRPAVRVALGVWAGLVYLVYWLGYLGLLSRR